jgi:hypothetical protein
VKSELQIGDHVAVNTLPNSPMGVIGSVKHTKINAKQINTIYVVFMDNPTDTVNGTHYARAHELLNLTERVRIMHNNQVDIPAYCP